MTSSFLFESIPYFEGEGPLVLILLPTRELVKQVHAMASPLRKHFNLQIGI